jgi:ribonuclease R
MPCETRWTRGCAVRGDEKIEQGKRDDMAKRTALNGVSHEAILDFFRRPAYTPMTAAELGGVFALRGGGRKALAQLLHQMVMNGEIVLIRKTRYSLGAPADLVTGRLEVKRSGDGYLTNLEGELSVRIERGYLGTALPGDLVVVRLEPQQPGMPEWKRQGKIIRVVERGRRVVVGTLKSTGKFLYVAPMDPSYQQDFYVPESKGAATGDRVVVQFTNWESRHVSPEAEIIEVIGPADNPSLDTLAIMRQYEFPESFPSDVVQEAGLAAARINEPGRRLDLRDTFIFTVDPATARDFDDALSLERDERGMRVLGVHIADVCHFVAQGGALDREACQRGNSVYLPDKVIPMLPEELSNGLCSLNPHQDRMAFSVFMTFDDAGRVVQSRFGRSIIRSKLRLTYEQALQAIQTPPGMRCQAPNVTEATMTLIRDVCDLALQLRGRRMAQWALDISLPESQVIIGQSGMIEAIRPVENDVSHQMIEECMVAANEAVDKALSERGVRLIHRLHEAPAEDKIEQLTMELRELGYQPGQLVNRRNLMEFIQQIKDTPLAHSAQMVVLRSMKRAVYSAREGGHFGLAKKFYAHFTSPIRRYPDLVVHRLLAAVLEGKGNAYAVEELEKLALHCSETEQSAEEAERELLEIKKYRFLAQQIEQKKVEVYDAVVVKVMNFGLFVELDELGVQGLVHVSAISDAFVRFDPGAKALRAGAEVFKLGTRLKVLATRVDFDKRKIDFAIHRPGSQEGRKQGGRSRFEGARGGRRGGPQRGSEGVPEGTAGGVGRVGRGQRQQSGKSGISGAQGTGGGSAPRRGRRRR